MKSKAISAVIVMGLLSFFSIQKAALAKPAQEIEIPNEEADAWHDLSFTIDKSSKISSGEQIFHVSGLYKGKKVGFIVELDSQWQGGKLADDIPLITYKGRVTLHADGNISDKFIQSLDHIYETKQNPLTMSAKTVFTGITLAGEPLNPTKEPVKIKLFYEVEEHYAEAYLHIDVKNSIIQLNEKDPEYRDPLVKALTMAK